jgi:hypothetical protein
LRHTSHYAIGCRLGGHQYAPSTLVNIKFLGRTENAGVLESSDRINAESQCARFGGYFEAWGINDDFGAINRRRERGGAGGRCSRGGAVQVRHIAPTVWHEIWLELAVQQIAVLRVKDDALAFRKSSTTGLLACFES